MDTVSPTTTELWRWETLPLQPRFRVLCIPPGYNPGTSNPQTTFGSSGQDKYSFLYYTGADIDHQRSTSPDPSRRQSPSTVLQGLRDPNKASIVISVPEETADRIKGYSNARIAANRFRDWIESTGAHCERKQFTTKFAHT
jgi:hypothetical protein